MQKFKSIFLFLSVLKFVRSDTLNHDGCGKGLNVTPLIIGGEGFERGSFPWLVALLYTGKSEQSFFCGGVLVNNVTVLTGKITNWSYQNKLNDHFPKLLTVYEQRATTRP